MVRRRRITNETLFRLSPVLITESAEEFEHLHDAFKDELKPRGAIEYLLLADIAEKAWEVRRLRSVKVNLINCGFRDGLRALLTQVSERRDDYYKFRDDTDRLATQWLAGDKKEVLELLECCRLDEHAIEAAAVQSVAPKLEMIDRVMASAESRLSKALRTLAELRGGLGRQLHATAERIIDGKVLALDNASKQSRPAAA
jgi:hypothetical protein